MKLLCVDDNETGRKLLQSLLQSRGHTVLLAQGGREALELAKGARPDMIVSDVLMPGMDGYELCRAVRADPALAGVVFVFYTAAYTEPDDQAFGMSLGADGYLSKPMVPDELAATLEAIAQRRRATEHQALSETDFRAGHEQRVEHKLLQFQGRLEDFADQVRRKDLALARLADHSKDMVLVVDRQGQLMLANAQFYQCTGVHDLAAASLRLATLLPAERFRSLLAMFETDTSEPLQFRDMATLNGASPAVAIDGLALVVGYQQQPALLLILHQESGVSEMGNLMSSAILAALREGLIVTDAANNIVAVNPAFTRITGYTFAEVCGRNPRILRSGLQEPSFYQRMWATLLAEGAWHGELWNRRRDGSEYLESLYITVVRDLVGQPAFYIGILADVSDVDQSRKRIEHLAHHDPLTDLPNREAIARVLRQTIADARRDESNLAVLFIDLDRFKTINDSLGHSVGDDLLVQLAKRLRGGVREGDVVGRVGGDEFIVILLLPHDHGAAERVAAKLLAEVSRPLLAHGHAINITPSIGIALFPDHGDTAEALIKNADAALYRAKDRGRNNYQFYTEDLNAKAQERLQLEVNLRQALARAQLSLVYQPQVRLTDGCFIGCEALVRWNHPELGQVSPAKFIPVAEEAGLIDTIGQWILRSACRQIVEWRAIGLPWVRVAVNLSAMQFRNAELPRLVQATLADTGIAPEYLELEMTESVLMRDVDSAKSTLVGLSQLGICLAVDDFGTGYSNLAYLKQLPVNILKIDQSFVRDLPDDGNDAAIVTAIIQMARSLKLKTLAEGIETPQQRDFLLEMGCESGQGYLYSKPLAADAFGAWLAEHAAST